MAIQPRNDYDVHFHYAKDHIEERLRMYNFEDKTWYSPEKLWHTFISVLSKDSKDYFEHHVKKLCQQLSPEAIQLKSLTQNDLRYVWTMTENLWPLPERPVFTTSTNAYIYCKKSLGGAQEKCVKAHIEILKDLFTMSDCPDPPDKTTWLLSLTLWTFYFYSKKKERKHGNYNSTAHVFHSDLVITFLALKCRFCPGPRLVGNPIPELPKLKRSIVHHGISPEDPPFQRLVLQQLLLLLPNVKRGDLRQHDPNNLATLVYWSLDPFNGRWLWQKKGISGILTIVKDQSRYMTLRQGKLRRNFVADKVRCELSAIAKKLEQEYDRILPLLSRDTLQALKIFRDIMEETQRVAFDDGSKLPPAPQDVIKNNIKLLNRLHHLILIYRY